MRLYIDKANLISFLDSRRDVEYMDIYADCERMIRRQLAVHYNFPKAQCNDDAKLQAWFLNATNGCGYNESPDVFANTEDAIYPPRPLKGTFYNQASREQLSSVYLIDADVAAIQRTHTVLIGGLGQELFTLKRLFCRNDYQYHKGYDLHDPHSFAGWAQLDIDGHIMPTTDIIISDRYLFKDDNIIRDNLSIFLRLFGQKKGSKINLVILTRPNGETDTIWQDRKKELSRELKYNKYCVVNISFILSEACPHDRIIITNYRYFKSGTSLGYCDDSGRLKTSGDSLDVLSIADLEAYLYAKRRINNIQVILNKLHSLNRNDCIIGDKVSNWLMF